MQACKKPLIMICIVTLGHCKEYTIDCDPSLRLGDFKTLRTKIKDTCTIRGLLECEGQVEQHTTPVAEHVRILYL